MTTARSIAPVMRFGNAYDAEKFAEKMRILGKGSCGMIFNVPGHIEMIREGLYTPIPGTLVKTESRRLSRGIYQVGKDYAVQRKRGVKAEPDIRIVMDRIWPERRWVFLTPEDAIIISREDAWAEGGYTPERYEQVFRELNPKWDGQKRWAYKFHAIKVLT